MKPKLSIQRLNIRTHNHSTDSIENQDTAGTQHAAKPSDSYLTQQKRNMARRRKPELRNSVTTAMIRLQTEQGRLDRLGEPRKRRKQTRLRTRLSK